MADQPLWVNKKNSCGIIHPIPRGIREFIYIGIVGSVFTHGPEDMGSIPGRVIPKTLKMVLDASLLNTQQYKVRIKGGGEQSRERGRTLPNTSV